MPAAVAARPFPHPAPVAGTAGSPADALPLRTVFRADAFEEACASRLGYEADEVKAASDILMEAAPLMVGKHVVVPDDSMVRALASRNNSSPPSRFFSHSYPMPAKTPSAGAYRGASGARVPRPASTRNASDVHFGPSSPRRTPRSGRRAPPSSPRESGARPSTPPPRLPDRAGKSARRHRPPRPTPSRRSPTFSARSTSTAWISSGPCASS